MTSPAAVSDDVWPLIRDARWFGGKGRPARVTQTTELAVLPGEPAVRVLVVEVEYASPTPPADVEHYLLPVVVRPDEDGEPTLVDATSDPAALSTVLRQLLAAGDAAETPAQHVRVHLVDRTGLHPDLPGHRFGGEQSNTSIMYGGADEPGVMLKLFRRLELGRNLDIEVHDVLGRAGGQAAQDAAHLFGWVEGAWTTSAGTAASADLAMLVERLTDVHDGYALAVEACRSGRSFAAEATALGHALRNVHEVLATSFPTATVDGAAVATLMRSRLDRAAAAAPALLPYVDPLTELFAAAAGRQVAVQRIHGDFHLGQALVAGVGEAAGWKIIDFEGEPLKSLPERMAPDARVRDVAGALRSFDYAGSAEGGPAGRAWVTECRDAFVAGWNDHPNGPASAAELALLRAYEADKAVYEVVYETRNRPDWIAIPLAGIEALVRPAAPTTPADPAPHTAPQEGLT